MLVYCLVDFDERHGNTAADKKHSGYDQHAGLCSSDQLEYRSAESGRYNLRKAYGAVEKPEITTHMLS